jgi:hypothetical protein
MRSRGGRVRPLIVAAILTATITVFVTDAAVSSASPATLAVSRVPVTSGTFMVKVPPDAMVAG